MDYQLFLIDSVYSTLNTVHSKYKSKIKAFLFELKENPFLDSDFQVKDSVGNRCDAMIIGNYVVYYFVDHACKEIKILDLAKAD